METYYMLFAWVVIIAVFYFLMIRPQRKKEKEHEAMVAAVAVGDSILTTSGFYGVVIDMTDDVVIVEFGRTEVFRHHKTKERRTCR